MSMATITSKGGITLPKGVRNILGLREHDQVIFTVEGDRAILEPVRRRGVKGLRGIFKGTAPYLGRKAEREAAMRHVAEHVLHPSR